MCRCGPGPIWSSPTAVGEEVAPSWNVAPTTQVYAVIDHQHPTGDEVKREVRTVRWGLVPSWADSPKIGSKLINARVESPVSKPSWRTAFRKRRAVLPALGYYEWAPRDDNGKVRKQPYYMRVDCTIVS